MDAVWAEASFENGLMADGYEAIVTIVYALTMIIMGCHFIVIILILIYHNSGDGYRNGDNR